jgi:hypothetical protein
MGPTGWLEPWTRLGDWQASSESSRARKSSNLILLFYTNLRVPTAERTYPAPIRRGRVHLSKPGGSSFDEIGFISPREELLIGMVGLRACRLSPENDVVRIEAVAGSP